MNELFLAIEIGGTKLQLLVGDALAKIIQRKRLTVAPTDGAAGIRRQIQEVLPIILREHNVAAIGVGFGGPVDWRTGKIARSHQIEGWSDFDLASWLQDLGGAPAFVDNDANVAALGETLHGAGAGFSPVFYVTLGSGVGGGLVVGNKIYHGNAPGESEIGHLRLDRQGTLLESRCSGWAVDANIRKSKAAYPTSLLSQMAHEPRAESKHLASAIAQKDFLAISILDELAGDLAFGLSHVVHLFHPAIIILGGGLSQVGEPLRQAVENALTPSVMEVFRPSLQVRLAGLGEDAVPSGALAMAGQRCLSV